MPPRAPDEVKRLELRARALRRDRLVSPEAQRQDDRVAVELRMRTSDLLRKNVPVRAERFIKVGGFVWAGAPASKSPRTSLKTVRPFEEDTTL